MSVPVACLSRAGRLHEPCSGTANSPSRSVRKLGIRRRPGRSARRQHHRHSGRRESRSTNLPACGWRREEPGSPSGLKDRCGVWARVLLLESATEHDLRTVLIRRPVRANVTTPPDSQGPSCRNQQPKNPCASRIPRLAGNARSSPSWMGNSAARAPGARSRATPGCC